MVTKIESSVVDNRRDTIVNAYRCCYLEAAPEVGLRIHEGMSMILYFPREYDCPSGLSLESYSEFISTTVVLP
jgi:hypothetical protein